MADKLRTAATDALKLLDQIALSKPGYHFHDGLRSALALELAEPVEPVEPVIRVKGVLEMIRELRDHYDKPLMDALGDGTAGAGARAALDALADEIKELEKKGGD